MDNFNLKKYLAEGNLLKEGPADNLQVKRLAKQMYSILKSQGAKVELETKVGSVDSKTGKLDWWDDMGIENLGMKDAYISYGSQPGGGKEGIFVTLVGDKAMGKMGSMKAKLTQTGYEYDDSYPVVPYPVPGKKPRQAQAVFISGGKGMSEALNENAPGYDTRKFGEALPTLESVKAAHEAKGEGYKDFVEDEEKEKLAKAGDLKEEAGMSELKMHLKQYQDGMIDGDDLANALEEIIYGSVTPPEYNTRYGR